MKKSIATLVLTGCALLGVVSPQNAIAADNSIVGAWEVAIFADDNSPLGTNLTAFHQDGTSVNSDPVDGAGVGVWKRDRSRSFVQTSETIVPANDPNFLQGSTIIVTGRLSFDNHGHLVGPFTLHGTFKDNTVASLTGHAVLTRIEINEDFVPN